MRYRQLGKTGLMVGEIGLGCEGFVEKDESFTAALLDVALENGVNCMDLYSSDPALRARLGRALRGRREQIVIQAHLCSAWKDGQYERTRDIGEVTASFEDLLTRLETDYIDIGMIHYVDSPDDWRTLADGPVMAYARQLKALGRIRHIGLSSHNPIAALEAVKSGMIEVLMFSVNPCYDLLPGDEDVEKLWEDDSYKAPLLNMDPARQALYETCSRQGVGITVMKAFGGGDLLNEDSPAGRALSVNQCIHYALTRPAVATVMSGAKTVEELEISLAYETAIETEKDYAEALAAFPKISWRGHCMYCGHCAPCPQGIDVAAVTKFLNLIRTRDDVPETVREHYKALPHKADECIMCGACEKRCPFEVPVRENMKTAAKRFGK